MGYKVFFFWENAKDLCISLHWKGGWKNNPPRRWVLQGHKPDQWTSQDVGKTTLSPWAPAFPQHRTLSLILSTSESIDGLALLMTCSVLCFHIIQGTSMAMDFRAFRCVGGMCSFAHSHQSITVGSWSGAWVGMPIQSRMMCHVCRAKGQARSRCWGNKNRNMYPLSIPDTVKYIVCVCLYLCVCVCVCACVCVKFGNRSSCFAHINLISVSNFL